MCDFAILPIYKKFISALRPLQIEIEKLQNTNNLAHLELWIVFACISYILTFVQIYSLYRFKSMQYLLIVKKRYPTLVITESILVSILFFTFPLYINALFKSTNFGVGHALNFLYYIPLFLTIPLSHAIVCIEVCRLWLVSYNLHYLDSSQNEQWKSQIDYTFTEKDWYLTHRNKYGNRNYIIIRVFFYFLCVVTSVLTIRIINYNLGRFVDAFFFLINTSIMVYIYFKCRKYKELNDNFLFYYECRATTIISCFCISVFIIAAIFTVIGFPLIGISLNILDTFAAFSAPSLMSTFWIARKISFIDEWNKEADIKTPMIQIHEMNSKSEEQSAEMKLSDILKNEEKFEVFIQWMYREFSDETILCFIEMVQFKEYIVEQMMNGTVDSDYKYINLLYDNIPKCSIIFCDNLQKQNQTNIEKFKDISHLLYEKYVQYNAEFEVNIAANIRMKYIRLDNGNWNMNVDEFVNVFDPIINEMFLFMRNSFVRYQQI